MCDFVSHDLAGFTNCVHARGAGIGHFHPFAVYQDAATLVEVKEESGHANVIRNNFATVSNMNQRLNKSPTSRFER